MPKYIQKNQKQNILMPINLSKQLPPDSIEFAINEIVENKIDIKPFEKKYKNDDEGRPAWNPKSLLKIILLAFSRGIFTSRRITKACEENITFIAISGWSCPHFTVIADFISGLEKEISQVFKEVLLICDQFKLLGGTTFALDGVKIPSNAGKEWSGTKKELERKAEKIEQTIGLLIKKYKNLELKENDENSDVIKVERKKREKQIKRLGAKTKKIKDWLKSNEPKLANEVEKIKVI